MIPRPLDPLSCSMPTSAADPVTQTAVLSPGLISLTEASSWVGLYLTLGGMALQLEGGRQGEEGAGLLISGVDTLP